MVDDTEIRGGPLRAAVSNLQFSILNEFGGEGGIRTHVPLTRQDAFEAPPLRPLRYLSEHTIIHVDPPAGRPLTAAGRLRSRRRSRARPEASPRAPCRARRRAPGKSRARAARSG